MATEITYDVVRELLPARHANDHKGTYGHLFVVGGSRGFTGAARLACESACRSGVGLVTAGVPRALADLMGVSLLEAMTYVLPSTDAESLAETALQPALDFADGKDAVALGPGIGQHEETARFVCGFTEKCTLPMIIDADALNCLSKNLDALNNSAGSRVLTPHPGEMGRLVGKSPKDVQQDREGIATGFARDHNCVVVLKGAGTVVASPQGQVHINKTGNAGMASGGTGDVLSGVIGALLAQGLKPADAALLGVYVHGLAGDIAADAMTQRALIARDVIAALPEAWRRMEREQ